MMGVEGGQRQHLERLGERAKKAHDNCEEAKQALRVMLAHVDESTMDDEEKALVVTWNERLKKEDEDAGRE